jgi:hypothetical protein
VPVKLWSDTEWGRVTVELSRLKTGDVSAAAGSKS